jgi:hypothetical protein
VRAPFVCSGPRFESCCWLSGCCCAFSQGFAYIEFLEADAVDNAIMLDNSELRGRQIKVRALNFPVMGSGNLALTTYPLSPHQSPTQPQRPPPQQIARGLMISNLPNQAIPSMPSARSVTAPVGRQPCNVALCHSAVVWRWSEQGSMCMLSAQPHIQKLADDPSDCLEVDSTEEERVGV